MIQEKTLEGSKDEEIIKEIVKDREMESIDAYGNLGGLVTAWIPILQQIAVKKMIQF